MNRRRVLKLMGLAGLAAGAVATVGSRRANAYYQGPPSDHFNGHQFFNPHGPGPNSFGTFLRWQVQSLGREPWPEALPGLDPDRPPPRAPAGTTRVSFVGHASYLIQTEATNILIDPVWSERASPVSFAGPRRINPPGVPFEALPRIDTVIVTHNHYDHLDAPTLARLWHAFRPTIVTPLGNDTIMRAEVPGIEAVAVDWWQTLELRGGIRLHAVPTHHWSARGLRDRRHALWASFVVETPAHRIYAVGDSGFAEGRWFAEIGRRHPDLDLALLPIGAYEPRWFHSAQHMSPEEAVRALELSGARRALGHHWGTFRLTDEAAERPAHDLAQALVEQGVEPERFVAVRPGAVQLLG